jgi:FixJ family two-component response regulator
MGAVLPGLHRATGIGVRLPRIGEVVYQGLPMASVTIADAPPVLVPSPVSGVVVAVNEALAQHAACLSSDPCGDGWLACVCTTRYEEELKNCRLRQVLLVNTDPRSAQEQAKKLAALGCQVQTLADRDSLAAALNDSDGRVLVLDAVSLGEAGPELAGLVNSRAPWLRIVVVAAQGAALETAYRKKKIFYYAVEPFADNEMADILAAAFRVQESPAPKPERPKGPSEPISTISITNRQSHKIELLAGPGLLWRNEGLGWEIGQRLLAMMFPVVVEPGEANLTPANILKTAGACDRVLVLLARDSGLLPGSLARHSKPDFGIESGDVAGKVTTLAVQPDAVGGIAGLDPRTRTSLADHIVREMASY